MSKIAICIDNSGSTRDYSFYWNNVNVYIKEILETYTGKFKYYLWNTYVSELENRSIFNIFMNNPISMGFTILSEMINILITEQNIKGNDNFTDVIIVSDGEINPEEIKKSTSLLLTNNIAWNIKILLCNIKVLDNSVFMPFSLCRNVTITFKHQEVDYVHNLTKLDSSLENFKTLLDNFDWKSMNDSEYESACILDLSKIAYGYNVRSNDPDSVVKLRAILKDKLNFFIRNDSKKIDPIILLKVFNTGDISEIKEIVKVERKESILYQTTLNKISSEIDKYCLDVKNQLFKNNNNTATVPIYKETIVEHTPDKINIDPQFYEKLSDSYKCCITFENVNDVINLIIFKTKEGDSRLQITNKEYMRQFKLNPLIILNDDKIMEDLFGSYFSADPRLQKVDPLTIRSFKEGDKCLILLLGSSDEHIKYNNSVMNAIFTNGVPYCDSDFLFMAIWYYAKYKPNTQYIKNKILIEAIENHLKARFNKNSRLCLGSDANENINSSTKYLAVVNMFFEIVINQTDEESFNHCTMSKFCYNMEILLIFLKDLYDINIPQYIIDYIKQYREFMIFRNYYNNTDKQELIRIITSINNGFLRIYEKEVAESVCKICDVIIATKENTIIDLSTKTKSIEKEEKIITSLVITIPMDSKEGSCNLDELLSYMPNKIKHMGKEKIIDFTLILFGVNPSIPFYYLDNNKNINNIEKGVTKLGYDPRINKADWTLDYVATDITLHPLTLRPTYSFKNNTTWLNKNEETHKGKEFISYYRYLYDFILAYNKVPNIYEYTIYVYKRSIAKPHQLFVMNGELRSRKMKATKLEYYFLEYSKIVLYKFNTLLKELKLDNVDTIVKMLEASFTIDSRILLESS